MKVEQKKLPKSQIELNFELTAEEFNEHFSHAIEHLKSHIKVDGFRPGQAPAKMVEEKIKPETLLMEAGDHAVRHVYTDYVRENKLEPVGNPEVSIIKIAKGSEFVFKAIITVLPEVELPEYKEIAKTVKGQEVSVTEQEVLDSLNYIQKTRAKFVAKNDGAEIKDFVEITYQNKDINEGKEVKDQFILGEAGFMKGFEDAIVGMKANEEKEITVKFPENAPRKDLAGKDANFKIKVISVQKMELPEMNDDFAKQLGAFETLTALKDNIKSGMKMEKEESEKQRKRAEILEKIAQKTKIEIPESIIEYEKNRMFEDFKNKVAENAKIDFDEYLSSIKKTEAEIKETYQKEAEKRIKGFLILRELGKRENLEVTEKEIDDEVQKATKDYPKEELANIDLEQFKEYTKGVIQNEKIFNLLENLA